MNVIELGGRGLIVSDVADPETWFDAIPDFAKPKRRFEWMVSRIAEKELRKRGAIGEHVSFSHSGKYGAAAIDVQPIGIDVEVVREISENAAHLFLNDDEVETMQRNSIPNRMLHWWAAKEAAWKQRGGAVPTLKKLRLRLVSEAQGGLRFEEAETRAIGELIAALTRPTS